MDTVLRLLLRFILVPLGYLAAILAGCCVVLFGSWKLGTMLTSLDPNQSAYGVFGLVVAGPILFVVLIAVMFLPAALGILISEAFAIRSWIYHALSGAASGWIGWQMLSSLDNKAAPLVEPPYVIAAGLAGGFAYWAVAGWSAGFWKPVFARPALLPAPTSTVLQQAPSLPSPASGGGMKEGLFNPPARIEP